MLTCLPTRAQQLPSSLTSCAKSPAFTLLEDAKVSKYIHRCGVYKIEDL